MKMEGTKVTRNRRSVYEIDLSPFCKKEVSNKISSSSLSTSSLVNLNSQRDFCNNNVLPNTPEPRTNSKAPLLTRRRFCINSDTMAPRFPLNLGSILNIAGKEMTVMGVQILRKSLPETIKALNDHLIPLEEGAIDSERNRKISKYLAVIKDEIVTDKGDQPASQSRNRVILTELISTGCLANLLKKLSHLRFEDRKSVSTIFCNLMRKQEKLQVPLVKYLEENSDIFLDLISGYEDMTKALICGTILRDCFRFKSLAKIVMESPRFYDLFVFVKDGAFEISSDALLTLRELLIEHKKMTAEFILANYDKFFDSLDVLIQTENYVTKLYSLKLLTELLLERHNYSIMTKYVSEAGKLKSALLLMSESESKNIQYEAFHAFKIFVGNPEPNYAISSILTRNRDRLVKFLTSFQSERASESFMDEKTFLINRLKEITKSSQSASTIDKL